MLMATPQVAVRRRGFFDLRSMMIAFIFFMLLLVGCGPLGMLSMTAVKVE
jgi:hypothetical protein